MKIYSAYCPACEHRCTINETQTTDCPKCGYMGMQHRLIEPRDEVLKRKSLRTIRGELPWFFGEVLPLKKHLKPTDVPMPITGVMLKGRGPTVIFSDIHTLVQEPTKADSANAKTYPSYEAIVEDGWRVD